MTRIPIEEAREESAAAAGEKLSQAAMDSNLPSMIPVSMIEPSKTNPRKRFDPEQLKELEESIRRLGVLQPLVVRPGDGKKKFERIEKYELVAGERRWTAAKNAGCSHVPCVVRELTDLEVVEIQLVENLQRADLHPLEEAQGYQHLLVVAKIDAARIGERVGRSAKYVYDRIKLLSLSKDLRELFLDGQISAGHAILLARLKPEDQNRAADTEKGGLFEHEHTLFHPDDDDRHDEHLKTRSVRELQGWIDEHVRFDPKAADPVLFPDTVSELERARKVVPITYDYMLTESARDPKTRTYSERAWKRADGQKKSKPCEHSITGYVAAGPARGEAFAVCVAKDKCTVHWAAEIRQRAKSVKSRARGDGQKLVGNGPPERDEELARALRESDQRARRRARTEAVNKLSVMSLRDAVRWFLINMEYETIADVLREKGMKNPTRKDVLRDIENANDAWLAAQLGHAALLDDWGGDMAKSLGVDLRKIEQEEAAKARAGVKAARAQTSAPKAAKKAKKKGRK